MPETKDLFAGVNRPADPENPTDLEKKHIPVIEVPETVPAGKPAPITVHVGKLLAHPNEHGHHIEFIDLYFDKSFLARTDLTGVSTEPKVTYNVILAKSGTLRAFESCNLHGVWENDQAVEVG